MLPPHCSHLLHTKAGENNETPPQNQKVTYGLGVLSKGQIRRHRRADVHRDVNYTHERWEKHRLPWRHFRHWSLLPFSATAQRLVFPDLMTVAAISGCLTYANILGGVDVSLTIMREFTLTTTVLGLLLVFRTNASNTRYNDARAHWGTVINSSRTLLRNAGTKVLPKSKERFECLVGLIRAFPRTLVFHLRNDGDLKSAAPYSGGSVIAREQSFTRAMQERKDELPELEQVLEAQLTSVLGETQNGASAVQKIMSAPHRPYAVLNMISEQVVAAELNPLISARLDQEVRTLEATLGGMERILFTPIPTSYTRHTSRFISMWTWFLPFALFEVCGIYTAPASLLVSYAMLAIEDIGVVLEEPFHVLPNWMYCDAIDKSADLASAIHLKKS